MRICVQLQRRRQRGIDLVWFVGVSESIVYARRQLASASLRTVVYNSLNVDQADLLDSFRISLQEHTHIQRLILSPHSRSTRSIPPLHNGSPFRSNGITLHRPGIVSYCFTAF